VLEIPVAPIAIKVRLSVEGDRTYLPFSAMCPGRHEYAKRQLARKGIALDNGILSCASSKFPVYLRRPSGRRIDGFLHGGPRILPHPLTAADRKTATGTTFQSFNPSSIDPGVRPTQCMAAPVHR
jgi:hypothetical protein